MKFFSNLFNFSMKLVILILILNINSSLINESNFQLENGFTENSISSKSSISLNYSISNPKIITKNSQFSLHGFSGNGTIEDPYIIENLSISNNTSDLIVIESTTVYFIIRNCFLNSINNSFNGISLENVSNGLLVNNTIINAYSGIYLISSTYNTIVNNTVRDCSYSGLFLNDSARNLFIKNKIIDNYQGITFRSFSKLNSIDKNIILSGSIGIHFKTSCSNNNITNNIISFNADKGIYFFSGSARNIISNNSLRNNDCGIFTFYSSDNNITSNIIENNRIGIHITHLSTRIIVTNNIIRNNSFFGLQIGYIDDYEGVTYCLITRNTFTDNGIVNNSQASDYESYNTFILNYWSDWISPDNDIDGIVDIPYIIDGNNDNNDYYPLVSDNKNISFHFLNEPIIHIPNIEQFGIGLIHVKWMPAVDSFGFSVFYSLFYTNDEGDTWITLTNNSLNTIYYWNATLFDSGCYQLKVIAESEGGLIAEDITGGFPLNLDHILSYPEFFSPNLNKPLSETVTIQWTLAIDNCYYSVNYNLSYSADGGNSWVFLASGINSTIFEWDTTTVSNGDNFKLKIVAISSSGLISTTITEKAFTINNDALQLFIKKIPFLDIFFVVFIFVELLSLNFLIKFIRKKKLAPNN